MKKLLTLSLIFNGLLFLAYQDTKQHQVTVNEQILKVMKNQQATIELHQKAIKALYDNKADRVLI